LIHHHIQAIHQVAHTHLMAVALMAAQVLVVVGVIHIVQVRIVPIQAHHRHVAPVPIQEVAHAVVDVAAVEIKLYA
jgi:hypothetical protein